MIWIALQKNWMKTSTGIYRRVKNYHICITIDQYFLHKKKEAKWQTIAFKKLKQFSLLFFLCCIRIDHAVRYSGQKDELNTVKTASPPPCSSLLLFLLHGVHIWACILIITSICQSNSECQSVQRTLENYRNRSISQSGGKG